MSWRIEVPSSIAGVEWVFLHSGHLGGSEAGMVEWATAAGIIVAITVAWLGAQYAYQQLRGWATSR